MSFSPAQIPQWLPQSWFTKLSLAYISDLFFPSTWNVLLLTDSYIFHRNVISAEKSISHPVSCRHPNTITLSQFSAYHPYQIFYFVSTTRIWIPWDQRPYLAYTFIYKHPFCLRDLGLIPRWGRSPGKGNDNLPQYSCLKNPTDRGAWWATVHGVAKSDMT